MGTIMLQWEVVAVLAVYVALLPTPALSFAPYLPPEEQPVLAGSQPCANNTASTYFSTAEKTATKWMTTTKAVVDLTTYRHATTETKTRVVPTVKIVATTEPVPIRNPILSRHLLTLKTESTVFTGGEVLSTLKPILIEPTVTIKNPKRVELETTLVEQSYSEKTYTADVTALVSSVKTDTCVVASTIVKANEVTTTTLTATKYLFLEKTVEPKAYTTTVTSTRYNVRTTTNVLPAVTVFTTVTNVDPLKLRHRRELQDTTTREEKPMPLSTIVQQTCVNDRRVETVTDFVPTVKFPEGTVTKYATRTLVRTSNVLITDTSVGLQPASTLRKQVYLTNSEVVIKVGKPFTIINAPTSIVTDLQNVIFYTLVENVHVKTTTVHLPCIKEYNYQELDNPIPY